jgi:hypothetical protein
MFAQQVSLDGWTIQTNAEEFRPDSWRVGDPVLYTGHGSAVFAAPQRDRGQWKSISRLIYPEGGAQKLFDTANAANRAALDDLITRINLLRQ